MKSRLTKAQRRIQNERAVEYHLRHAEAFRKSARSGHIPQEEIDKLLKLAEKFERDAEYYASQIK